MNKEIIAKYSVPVPRYTSYPPANFFTEEFATVDFRDTITASNSQNPKHISIYIHMPFCVRLCHYCGCNAWLMQRKSAVNEYIEALKKEIRMVLPLLDKGRKISQIHYGGGTPTAVPVEVLCELNQMILSEFECIEQPEIAIECHSGYMDETYWTALMSAGFNRISLGVQDFNEDVLKASNRKPSLLPIEEIMQIIRSHGISVNLDFIYGLPLQTTESFAETIEKAVSLRPDRMVTFSYAHVPWVNPNMKKLEAVGLPGSNAKAELFARAKQILTDVGYLPLGLDHFVLPDDELAIAAERKMLKRNFQGYCTARTTGQVYAFGVTGISQLADAYAQNEKSIDRYTKRILAGELPIVRGYRLSREEQITREVISGLMCNHEIQWQSIADEMKTSVSVIKSAVNLSSPCLSEFVTDGIIEWSDERIAMKPEAAFLVRNVAASLDKLLINTDKQFSKSV